MFTDMITSNFSGVSELVPKMNEFLTALVTEGTVPEAEIRATPMAYIKAASYAVAGPDKTNPMVQMNGYDFAASDGGLVNVGDAKVPDLTNIQNNRAYKQRFRKNFPTLDAGSLDGLSILGFSRTVGTLPEIPDLGDGFWVKLCVIRPISNPTGGSFRLRVSHTGTYGVSVIDVGYKTIDDTSIDDTLLMRGAVTEVEGLGLSTFKIVQTTGAEMELWCQNEQYTGTYVIFEESSPPDVEIVYNTVEAGNATPWVIAEPTSLKEYLIPQRRVPDVVPGGNYKGATPNPTNLSLGKWTRLCTITPIGDWAGGTLTLLLSYVNHSATCVLDIGFRALPDGAIYTVPDRIMGVRHRSADFLNQFRIVRPDLTQAVELWMSNEQNWYTMSVHEIASSSRGTYTYDTEIFPGTGTYSDTYPPGIANYPIQELTPVIPTAVHKNWNEFIYLGGTAPVLGSSPRFLVELSEMVTSEGLLDVSSVPTGISTAVMTIPTIARPEKNYTIPAIAFSGLVCGLFHINTDGSVKLTLNTLATSVYVNSIKHKRV